MRSIQCIKDKLFIVVYVNKLLSLITLLQTDKVDLENTVVDESQRQWNDQENSNGLMLEKFSGMFLFNGLFIRN